MLSTNLLTPENGLCSRSEESYQSYLEAMPWTALPFKSSLGQELASVLDVHGIPTLVLLDPDDRVITGDARNHIKDDLDGEVSDKASK